MAWYDDFFSSEAWQRVQAARFPAAHSAEQAEQLIELLGLARGARILDVPCGTGRLSVPLAAAGMLVTGVDITDASLQRAAASAREQGVSLDLHRQDMRDLPWAESFDAILNMWGSFGYFDHAGNVDFLEAAAAALRPGGALVIEGPCLEGLLPRWSPRDWYPLGDDVTILEDRSFDPLSGVTASDWTVLSEGQPVQRCRVETVTYSLAELHRMLVAAGFSSVAAYRDLTGAAFRPGDRMHLIARR